MAPKLKVCYGSSAPGDPPTFVLARQELATFGAGLLFGWLGTSERPPPSAAVGHGGSSSNVKLMIVSPNGSVSVSVSPPLERLELGPYWPATVTLGYLSANRAGFFATTTNPPAGIVAPGGNVKSIPAVKRRL